VLPELLAASAVLLGPTPGEAAVRPLPLDQPYRRVLVTFAAGRRDAGLEDLRGRDGRVRRSFAATQAVAADLPRAEIERLERERTVVRVEPDPPRRPFGLAEAELEPALLNGLYGLLSTRALPAQAATRTDGTTVCVADTGVDGTHPDIAPSYEGGVDSIDRDDDPSAPLGGTEDHGTHVAGTIVGALNGYGVRGVAPGVRLVHARVLGSEGGSASSVMDGVRRLVDERGCAVINMSLGGGGFTQAEADFYAQMAERGVVIVAASGNEAASKVAYPAAYPGVISVGAVNRQNEHAIFSNVGEGLDLGGPGVDVLSALPRGTGRSATISVSDGDPVEVQEVGNSGLTEGVSAQTADVGPAGSPSAFAPAAGKVALVFPDPAITMRVPDLLTAAMNVGAVAVALVSPRPTPYVFTLPSTTTNDGRPWLPVVALTADQGENVRQAGAVVIANRPSDWGHLSGTSMASPHVAGVAALVRATRPSLTPEQVERILESTAVDLGPSGYDTTYGNGLVDAERAVAAARSTPTLRP
jgi:subtilisin family serine protease